MVSDLGSRGQSNSGMSLTRFVLLVVLVFSLILVSGVNAAAADEPDEDSAELQSVNFSESEGCFEWEGVRTPASETDSLPNRGLPSSHVVRGPWGDTFGRDYNGVAGSIVTWNVPGPSVGGRPVHELALPAFEQVTAGLEAAAAEGKVYDITTAGSWVWRRIGGSYRMSTHSFGITIDINSASNPYRSDNVLVTDMPDWFVDIWRDAGFCWGGDWQSIKDPMHFSWIGPLATPGYGEMPDKVAPRGTQQSFTVTDLSTQTSVGEPTPGALYGLEDANRDGAVDLIEVTSVGDDLRVVASMASALFGSCSDRVDVIPGVGPFDRAIVGDFDGKATVDVLALRDGSDAYVLVHDVFKVPSVSSGTLAAPVQTDDLVAVGTLDMDQFLDLVVISTDPAPTVHVMHGPSFADGAPVELPVPVASGWRLALGDRTADGIDDLWLIEPGESIELHVVDTKNPTVEYQAVTASSSAITPSSRVWSADWDGDGHDDLYSMVESGQLDVFLGGERNNGSEHWFATPDTICDPTDSPDPTDPPDLKDPPVSGVVSRLWGLDRYATSAAISEASFAPGVPVVYVAVGTGFADALSVAPVGGVEGAPVLLTKTGSLPGAIATELDRLDPERIVVVGGSSVVSDAVMDVLVQYAVSGSVSRLWGSDRYATSAAISAASFAPGVPVVYVAVGTGFADALSVAPVGGVEGAPVLLTKTGSLPGAIATELDRLDPERIVVVGGAAVVSDAVVGALEDFAR